MIDNRTKAAIHVAKAKLALTEDSYRDIMERVAGVRSSNDLDDAGARRLMAEFERLGFVNSKKRKRKGHDDRPLARKAVAMWIALYNLDEVESADDRALNAFVKRLHSKELLRFCDTAELNMLVEALKAWAGRIGQTDRTQLGVVLLQIKRLKAANPAEVADVNMMAPGDLGRLANRLGERVRRLKLGTRHNSQKEGA